MKNVKILKTVSAIVITLTILIFILYFPSSEVENLEKIGKTLVSTSLKRPVMLASTNYPIVSINKDSMIYSQFGIFFHSYDHELIKYTADNSIEVNKNPETSRIAWEIYVLYFCVLFFFGTMGKVTKQDRPPPFYGIFLIVAIFVAVFTMIFGLIGFIIFAISYLGIGGIVSLENPVSKRILEWELYFGLEADTLLMMKLAVVFEFCFLIAAALLLNTTIKPLAFGFEYQGTYFILMIIALSALGFFTTYYFTKRKPIELESSEEVISSSFAADEM